MGSGRPGGPATALMSVGLTATGATFVGAKTVVVSVAAAATPASTAALAATVAPVPNDVPIRRQ